MAKSFLKVLVFILLPTVTFAHSGGLDSKGCHAGSQPYHCHGPQREKSPKDKVVSGSVDHIRDGDTIVVGDVAIRLAGLDCPENGTKEGKRATAFAQKMLGKLIECQLTGATTYDRVVAYCTLDDDIDWGREMMANTECKVWEKYDIWSRY